MDEGPGPALGTLGWFLGAWVVMMAAMMFPSVAPTVALYSRMTQARSAAPLLFTAGYLVDVGGGRRGRVRVRGAVAGSPATCSRGISAGRWIAGATLLVAAVYELTPLKDVCLGKCRSPLGFLLGVVARRLGRRPPDGREARRLVRRLLLGADGVAVRARAS